MSATEKEDPGEHRQAAPDDAHEDDVHEDYAHDDSDAAFEAPVRGAPETDDAAAGDIDALIVNIDGYEGPLDILLELARAQKVDLRKISILALVEQYLLFVEAAKDRRLELAADYLVMAAWLAFLKSKLLLPVVDVDGEEPTADEMAARLAFQLQRLEAMRKASEALHGLPQMGADMLACGSPEGVRVVRRIVWSADMFDLLQAYSRQRIATIDRHYKPELPKVMTIEEARHRLARMLGGIPDWVELASLVPAQDPAAPPASIVASSFNAALEFAKDGRIELQQAGHYAPIYIRKRSDNQRTDHPDTDK